MASTKQRLSVAPENYTSGMATDSGRAVSDRLRPQKSWIMTGIFWIYRFIFSPALHAIGGIGFGCRYTPSCSHYAEEAFSQLPIRWATFLSIRRILRCNPWIKADPYDPVPKTQEER